MSKKRTKKIKAERFVRVWQRAASLDVVAKSLSLAVSSVRTRAASYRRKGVPLKKFKRVVPIRAVEVAVKEETRGRRPLDLDKLRDLAAKFAPAKKSVAAKRASKRPAKRRSKRAAKRG